MFAANGDAHPGDSEIYSKDYESHPSGHQRPPEAGVLYGDAYTQAL